MLSCDWQFATPWTVWDPMDCIVLGVLQARILEWVAFPFSRGSSQPKDWTQVSHIAGWAYKLSYGVQQNLHIGMYSFKVIYGYILINIWYVNFYFLRIPFYERNNSMNICVFFLNLIGYKDNGILMKLFPWCR